MAAPLLVSGYGKTPFVVDVGQTIGGKYKLLRLLGDGGMGSVYEAEHIVLGTLVAIKVLHPNLTRKAGLIDRFLREARVSAQIRSPHVVHVTDVDRTPEGVAFLVMELLQGEPLSNVVRRERKLGVTRACEYTMQILEALESAHALGVIHRDLKPDNVFVTFEGGKPNLKLIDFGIAKLKQADGTPPEGQKNLTVAGMLMGTPEYMAPEQAYAADKVDVRADVYSVGAMLYEMLSGQTPVSGEDPRVVVLKVERGEVTPLVHLAPDTPPEVCGLVHRAMAPRPELRFSSATEMRLALSAVLGGKRPATANLQAAPGAPAELGSTQKDFGTGTVMGAPAPGALGPAPHVALSEVRGSGSTVRAVPIDIEIPPQGASAYRSAPPPRRSNGLVIALAVLALLLGAGAVVAYVMGTMPPPGQSTDPLATTTTATVGTTTTTAATMTATTSTTTVAPPPLSAANPTQPTAPPATGPKPSASTAPSTKPSASSSSAPPALSIPGLGTIPIVPFPSVPLIPSERPPGWPEGIPWPPKGLEPPAPPPSR